MPQTLWERACQRCVRTLSGPVKSSPSKACCAQLQAARVRDSQPRHWRPSISFSEILDYILCPFFRRYFSVMMSLTRFTSTVQVTKQTDRYGGRKGKANGRHLETSIFTLA